MLAQQIRTWDVRDERVLAIIGRTPREDYVPAQYRNVAYADMTIPLGHGQVMMAPKVEARLLQALDISPKDKILEVGTGSGYVTALLANLGGHVYSVEIISEFEKTASEKLLGHGIRNVTLEVGDAAAGWERHAPYDVIFITGSVPALPHSFRESLRPGGRLAAIVGEPPTMEALRVIRVDREVFVPTSLFDTELPPLINAKGGTGFVF